MEGKWIDRERKREADRERELEKKRVVYIKSDLYSSGEFVPEHEARLVDPNATALMLDEYGNLKERSNQVERGAGDIGPHPLLVTSPLIKEKQHPYY